MVEIENKNEGSQGLEDRRTLKIEQEKCSRKQSQEKGSEKSLEPRHLVADYKGSVFRQHSVEDVTKFTGHGTHGNVVVFPPCT